MVIIFKTTCLIIMVAVGLLFRHLFVDWKAVRSTDTYLNNTTPLDRFKYNGVFALLTSCLTLVFVLFLYLLACKVTIESPLAWIS